MSVSFDAVIREKGTGFFPHGTSFKVSKEVYEATQVYLVIPRYSDGGTFGRTIGYWCVQGAYTNKEEASKLARSIRGKNFKTEYPEMAQMYMPWEGYFSALQDVEIHYFTIRNRNRTDQRRGDHSIIFH